MWRIIPFLIIALTGASAVAQTYRWVDERGVTNYGSKPPAGRPAQVVDTQPQGFIETRDLELKRYEAETRRQAELAQPAPPPSPAPAPSVAITAARGMEFGTFRMLRRGMSEGELLSRAGNPDHVSVDSVRRDITRAYYYYATISDPFITVITVRGGRIWNLERTKKF